ncbi:MAG: hypothetical protein LBS43_08765 [Prevotellaceae bacterium]|nr:hypothetical protein [Prevotellaceae bacterium]
MKKDRIEENFSAKGLRRAREILDYLRLSKEDKAVYDAEQAAKSRYFSQINSAKEEGAWETKKIYSKVIEEKDKTIAKKDKTIEEKDKAIEEKDKTLAKQAQEIEELKRLVKQNTKNYE